MASAHLLEESAVVSVATAKETPFAEQDPCSEEVFTTCASVSVAPEALPS